MSDPAAAPVLQSILPLGAVPPRLRDAVTRLLATWGYGWDDVSFAGTATLPAKEHPHSEPVLDEVWVLAVTAGPVAVGDELEVAGGRGQSLGVSRYSGGVIPVTPYVAFVYECLGRRRGGGAPECAPRPAHPATSETERAAPDQLR